MNCGSIAARGTTKTLVVCLAILALLFITTEAGFNHHHGNGSSAACPACHAAQHAPAPAATAAKMPALVALAWRAPRETLLPVLETLPEDHPSRAPPAFSL